MLGLSSEVLKSCKLIDLLAPTICKEHRIIVDSLFTCVFDLALLYVEQKPKRRTKKEEKKNVVL